LIAGIVDVKDVQHIWHKVEPMLDKVCNRSQGELLAKDYLPYIINGDAQLWVAVEDGNIIISMVTQFIEYPQKKILRVTAIAGEKFSEIHEKFNDMFESFAIDNGCTALELWGRKGWKKMLPEWSSKYIVFTKELTKRMH
jgi:hypothetical protein